MYVQVQGQGGWSAPYPTCNQVNLLCSSVTLVIKQPVPLWQIYMWSLCLCGSGNAPCLTRIGCLSHTDTGALSQPYTFGHVVISCLSQSLTLGTALVMSALPHPPCPFG